MELEFIGKLWDFDDPIDQYYLHEYLIHRKYKKAIAQKQSSDRLDKFSRVFNDDLIDLLNKREQTGSWFFAREKTRQYNSDMFENVSDDFCMCWKKTTTNYDTLIIHISSFAGHEGRLKSELTNINPKITNLPTDLLVVNEDPFRMPESVYPAYFLLGCSEENNSIEKMCNQIRSYIKKEYKHVVVLGDSKHAASTIRIAQELSDVVTNVFLTGGMTTYSWDKSPVVARYFKWYNRPKELEHQFLNITDIEIIYMVKAYNFKKMGLDDTLVDPMRYMKNYSFKVDYYYGKYDVDYISFLNYALQFESDNFKFHEVDYKISENQTHNIRPYVDRKLLPEYIKNL